MNFSVCNAQRDRSLRAVNDSLDYSEFLSGEFSELFKVYWRAAARRGVVRCSFKKRIYYLSAALCVETPEVQSAEVSAPFEGRPGLRRGIPGVAGKADSVTGVGCFAGPLAGCNGGLC